MGGVVGEGLAQPPLLVARFEKLRPEDQRQADKLASLPDAKRRAR